MTYSKQTWQDFNTGGTPISAERLNHIEDGIEAASTAGASTDAGLVAHLADASDAHDASAISVTDAGGLFVGTDVEDVTQELGLAVERYTPAPSFLLRQRLGNLGLGGPVVVTLAGDSTGNDTTDWFYPFVSSIAAAYPAWTVQHRLWSDTNQGYLRPTYIQSGTNGDGYLVHTGAGTCSTPDSATVSLTSCDVRVQAKVRIASLVSGSEQVIASQFGSAGNRSWRFYITPSGLLYFGFSADGTTLVDLNIASAANMSATFTAGTDIYIGCTFTRNNGSNCSAQAIYSTDGTNWSNFGTAATGTSIAGLFDSTQTPEVGARASGNPLGGRIYWVEVYKGTANTDVLAWRFDASLYDSGTSLVDAEGRTWTLAGLATITRGAPVLLAHNASVSGQNVSYFDNATRRPLVLSAQTDILIVNSGHNEGSADFGSTLATYITNAQALWPSMAVVVCKQNPQHSTATNYRRHARSMCKLGNQAALNAWGVIDAFQAFQDTGAPDDYTASADVHPNAAGFTLWTNEALRTFGFA